MTDNVEFYSTLLSTLSAGVCCNSQLVQDLSMGIVNSRLLDLLSSSNGIIFGTHKRTKGENYLPYSRRVYFCYIRSDAVARLPLTRRRVFNYHYIIIDLHMVLQY